MNDILKTNLIMALHLDTLPEAEQEKVLLDVGEIIYKKVLLRVLDELSEKDKDEFDVLLADHAGDEDAIFSFLSAKIPNLEAVVNEEIASFKQSSIEFMERVTKP